MRLNKEATQARIKKCLSLKKKGFSYREIVKNTGWSITSIAGYLKKGETPENGSQTHRSEAMPVSLKDKINSIIHIINLTDTKSLSDIEKKCIIDELLKYRDGIYKYDDLTDGVQFLLKD